MFVMMLSAKCCCRFSLMMSSQSLMTCGCVPMNWRCGILILEPTFFSAMFLQKMASGGMVFSFAFPLA